MPGELTTELVKQNGRARKQKSLLKNLIGNAVFEVYADILAVFKIFKL